MSRVELSIIEHPPKPLAILLATGKIIVPLIVLVITKLEIYVEWTQLGA